MLVKNFQKLMNLTNLKSLFINNGCKKVYVKTLAPNDNSKNQVYFGQFQNHFQIN